MRRAWPEAEAAYAAVLVLDPERDAIWVQYGHALKERGFLSAAENAYRRALTLNGSLADTHLQLGHVLKLQGQRDAAVMAYRDAYLRDPTAPQSRAELAALRAAIPDTNALAAFRRLPSLLADGKPGGQSTTNVHDFAPDQRFISAVYGRATTGRGGTTYISVPHLLNTHDLDDNFLKLFNPNWYFYTNLPVRAALREPDPDQCLVHFCEAGIEAVLTISERYAFDAEFYKVTYLSNMPFTAANTYRHWLNLGLRQGWAPNKQAWVRSKFGQDLPGVDRLDITLCTAVLDHEIIAQGWTAQFEHFVNGGAADPRAPLLIDERTVGALVAVADRMSVRDKEPQSFALYQRILQHIPHHWPAMQHYADGLLRRNCLLEAKRVYQAVIDGTPNPSIWAFINVSKCNEHMGMLAEAMSSLRKGIDAFPGDVGLRTRFAELAQVFFGREWDVAIAAARLGMFEPSQARLAAACSLVSSLMQIPGALPPRTVRGVALVADQDLPQCRFYRVDQKVEQLERAGYTVGVYDYHGALPQFLSEIHQFEAVIFYRVPALPDVAAAIARARELGLLTFYEIDDLIFDAAEYPTSLASYDGQIDENEYAGLKLGVPLFAHAMSLCDFALASTTALADRMAPFVATGQAFVHRNAFGSRHEAFAQLSPAPRPNTRVTVFYGSGTKAHKEDFQELVEPALVELVRRHGDRVAIVLMGYITMTDRLRSIADNLTLIAPNWDLDAYWAMLNQVDINIAVLKPSLMADCKSEIKWLEAAMFAVPSVVSDTATFREVVEPGITGLLCTSPADWTAALSRLVGDDGLRKRMGLKARERAIAAYGMQAMADNLRQILDRVGPAVEVEKPTILIVNVFYPPQAIGGATRVVHDNVCDLARMYGDRFHLEVFTSINGGKEPYQVSSFVQDGVRVTGVTTPDRADHNVVDEKMAAVFGRFLDHLAPALVHFHCIQRLTTSIVSETHERRIPYVISVHDGWWISDNQFLLDAAGRTLTYDYADPLVTLQSQGQPAFDRLMRLQPRLQGATCVLAVSEPFAEIYRNCGVGKVVTVANGVSVLPKLARVASADGRVRLGFIGGLSAHKGYELLKYAICGQTFENLRLLVIDHSLQPGDQRRELWGNTEVEFQPQRPQNQVGSLYGQIDVLLAPSVWPESYGLVAREALHCGCWVVASDRGSIGEYVLDGLNGFIVDVNGPDGLIAALQRIDRDAARYLNSPTERPVMRTTANQADELAELYLDILGREIDSTPAKRSVSAGVVEPEAEFAKLRAQG